MMINVPMITTTVVDYCLFGGCIALFLWFVPASGSITAWQSVWFLGMLLNLIHIRDYCYLYTLPHHLTAKQKREYKETWTDLYFVGKQYVLFLGLTGILTQCGFFHMKFDGTNTPREIILILLPQFYAIALLKDNTGMRYLHPLMHTSWWEIHKQHHGPRSELRVLTTFSGDWSDLLLETAGGPVVYLAACYMAGWPLQMNIISWFMIVWMDINTHSINPFTIIYWNPLLDHIFKANIGHNMHHVFLNDPKYMMFWPWHHLSPEARDADIQRYNKVMATNVSFDWFLLDDPKSE